MSSLVFLFRPYALIFILPPPRLKYTIRGVHDAALCVCPPGSGCERGADSLEVSAVTHLASTQGSALQPAAQSGPGKTVVGRTHRHSSFICSYWVVFTSDRHFWQMLCSLLSPGEIPLCCSAHWRSTISIREQHIICIESRRTLVPELLPER